MPIKTPNKPPNAPKQGLYTPGEVIYDGYSCRCSMCHKIRERKQMKTWFEHGEIKTGCLWCMLSARKEYYGQKVNENPDNIL